MTPDLHEMIVGGMRTVFTVLLHIITTFVEDGIS